MRRIYFLVPNITVTHKIVDELLLAKIEEKHIHVLAKRGTPLENLPEANLLQKSDFIPAVEQGLALGGATGLLAGLVAIALPPASTVVAGGILLGSGLAGAGIGAWLSGMVGMSIGNRRTKEFEEAIEAGEFLILADVSPERVNEIETLIRKHIPEVEVEQTEPRIPAFP
ncbi:MAG: DUF1269 domain-containing protein [Nitrosomonas sp.]|jgi:hypothetical protein|nr:DUF1269 domain-containing protein [Nitrosomonas sp.]